MTAAVYIVDDLDEVDIPATLRLDGEEGRHAAAVKRARVGEQIDVVNGRGIKVHAHVIQVLQNAVVLQTDSVVRETPDPVRITLVQALATGGRDEQAIETATEYGVCSVIPWQAHRSTASWAHKAVKGKQRWVKTVRAASKQSRRSWIPSVADVVTSQQLVHLVEQSVSEGEHVLVCHEAATSELIDLNWGELLRPDDGDYLAMHAARVTIIVGPEGGIDDEELKALQAAGSHVVLLARHVLRSSSAGAYAIAQIVTMESLVRRMRHNQREQDLVQD
ncbi:MAG: 16S rRNA (uracil(1498)-N(3))-methyltransferase [Actinomycetaceae bacterium]|nr:16S rRNA (uracil(1498)-N(3))-methyltransferase [Actinomycetaceae bacterium]